MHRSPLAHVRLVLVLVISAFMACGSLLVHAEENSRHPLPPLLVSASAAGQTRGVVKITGRDFTAGNEVYIAFYDAWGRQLFETRWVVASQAVYGPNGSQDPANGFIQGGTISELFGPSGEIFGPNGSQDPANGYVHQGSHVGFGSLCGATAMVRAYDEQKDAWSNMLEVDARC